MNLYKRLFGFVFCIVAAILVIDSVGGAYYGGYGYSGAYSSAYMNYQPSFQSYYSSSAGEGLGSRLSTYWSILDSEDCKARQDVLLQVAPIGCTPSVVRSDLLEERNVPVFCQVNALQLNPLININSIDSLSFTGTKYPKEVVGAGFHPARAALRTRDALLGDPLINNIGYVVVVLRRTVNESSMPDKVNLTLNARILYESGNAFGIGKSEFILEEESDVDWQNNKYKQSFLRGNYFIRLEKAEPEYALVSLYEGDRKLYTIRVNNGKLSNEVYLPGFYCQAALQLEYRGYEAAQKKVRIEINDEKGTETIDLYEGSKFLDNRCNVRKIELNKDGETGNVTISCDYNNPIILQIVPRAESFFIGESVNYSNSNWIIENITGNGQFVIKSSNGQEIRSVSASEINHIILAKQKDKNYGQSADDAFYDSVKAYEKVADEYSAEREKPDIDNITIAENALYRAYLLAKQFGKTETEYNLLQRLVRDYYNPSRIKEYNNELSYLSRIDSSLSSAMLDINGRYRTIRVLSLGMPKKASTASFTIVKQGSSGAAQSTQDFTLKDQEINSIGIDEITSVKLKELKVNSAILAFTCKNSKNVSQEFSVSLELGKTANTNICNGNYAITYRNADIERIARIGIVPIVRNAEIRTNLSVAIGIEKRAIKLNPDKTQEKIENINDSIKKWESISENLGKAVTTFKGMCLATAGVLTVKNFIKGVDGSALARQKVMQEYGWSERCREAYSSKGAPLSTDTSGQTNAYVSIDDCFRRNSEAINKDVESMKNIINKQNEDIKGITSQSGNSRPEGLFGGKVADYDKVGAQYCLEKLDKVNGIEITQSDYSNGTISYEQCKRIVLANQLISDSSVSEQIRQKARNDLETLNKDFSENRARLEQQNQLKQSLSNDFGIQSNYVNFVVPRDGKQGIWAGGTVNQIQNSAIKDKITSNGENTDTKYSLVHNNGKQYIVTLDENAKNPNGGYAAKNVYTNGNSGQYNLASDAEASQIRSAYPYFKQYDLSSYKNPYQNPEIRYYEVDPYKGVPQVVPVDKIDGWYAGVKKDLPLLGAKQSVDASGAIASFWLCNVGKNGKEEFNKDGFGDDICKRFDFYTGQALDDFPGINDKSYVNRLVQKSVNSLKAAQEQYKSGVKTVRLPEVGDISVGNPAIVVNGAQCQDFMSPDDCLLMFNVCDPVICPNSRCNLGGQFYVSDVIQSGIVGSALLCLPNIREKIYVPVCLTGLKAGIDSYLSVLKSHRDCLQTNLESGQMIGICDQIYSVYMCDFFWRQIAPAANVLLPKLVDWAYGKGQGTRGGGEYMTTMFAWENARKSVDYFTQMYAANSFKAFQARSTEEVGTQFCKAFISARSPKSIKTLLEPDSPPQFYATFDSVTYSTATLPATAQYKVYYHIFAGNDAGVYYSVYLRNPPATSYYSTNPTMQIASGFIAQGQEADETRDFPAPEGYKELCVRINDKEECGFKQVSTSFALNYVKDKVVANQIKDKSIETEQECISGAGAANGEFATSALLNINAQAAAQEALNPQIYERGIIRVCSTANPASSTNPGRYVQVGYCGNSKIKCWLDTKSVNNAITAGNVGVRNATLKELEDINIANLKADGQLMIASEAVIKVRELKIKINGADVLIYKGDTSGLIYNISKKNIDQIDMIEVNSVINEIDNIFLNSIVESSAPDVEKMLLNSQKAQLLLLKAEIKGAIAMAHLRKVSAQLKNDVKQSASSPTQTVTATPGTQTSTTPTQNKQIISGTAISLSNVKSYDDLKSKIPLIIDRYFRKEVIDELELNQINFVNIDSPITDEEKQQAQRWKENYAGKEEVAADAYCGAQRGDTILIRIKYSTYTQIKSDERFVKMIMHEILHCVSRYHTDEIGYSKLISRSDFNKIYNAASSTKPFNAEYQQIEYTTYGLRNSIYQGISDNVKDSERFSYLGSSISIAKDYSSTPSFSDVSKYPQEILKTFNCVLKIDDIAQGENCHTKYTLCKSSESDYLAVCKEGEQTGIILKYDSGTKRGMIEIYTGKSLVGLFFKEHVPVGKINDNVISWLSVAKDTNFNDLLNSSIFHDKFIKSVYYNDLNGATIEGNKIILAN